MKLISIIKFSWKNLWAHRLRAVLTVGGVAIGVASIVFLVSIGFGLERLVTSQVANFDAFMIIDVPSSTLKTAKINKEALDRIQNLPHIVSIDQVVDMAGRVKFGLQNSTTETVAVAVNPNYFKLTGISPESGKFFTADSTDEVVINSTLAGMLGFTNPNDALNNNISLNLIIARDLREVDSTDGPIEKQIDKLKVVGIVNESQNPIAYLPLNVATKFGVINNTSLKIKVDDRLSVETVRKSIENLGFSTEYVGDTVQQIEQVFSLFRIILAGFGIIALIVAALGTFNTLTISLMERIREIGLLKTLGMKKKNIFKIFITESMTIGVLGGILGLVLGQMIGVGLDRLLASLAAKAGADPVTIFYTPSSFIIITAIGSLLVGFLTGFYPAFRAIKTSALDALRYE